MKDEIKDKLFFSNEDITFYGNTEEEKKANEELFNRSLLKTQKNDEIKEILEEVNKIIDNTSYNEDFTYFQTSHISKLLDYITNLQDKIKQYEDPEDLTLFYMWLDEKAKDKMKQLQEENKNLKQINEEHRELNGNLRTANNTLCEVEEFMYNQAKDYKTRNEKAIEYINHITDELTVDFWNDKTDGAFEDLLEILQGSDN